MEFLKKIVARYLLLVPIIWLLISAVWFWRENITTERALLMEKFDQAVTLTESLAAAVEANTDRKWLDHEQNIRNCAEYIDSLYQVFGAAYKPFMEAYAYRQDGGSLELITEREYETSPFEPLQYAEFTKAVGENEKGTITINYKPEKQDYRDLHMYYRWMPLYSSPKERFLVVVGVSKYSVVSTIPMWKTIGQIANILVTFAFNVCAVIAICRSRGGKT